MASQPVASAMRWGKSRHMASEPRPSCRKTMGGASGRGWAEGRRTYSSWRPWMVSSCKSDSQMLVDQFRAATHFFAGTVENHLALDQGDCPVGDCSHRRMVLVDDRLRARLVP